MNECANRKRLTAAVYITYFICLAALLCTMTAVISGCAHKHEFVYTELSSPDCRESGTAVNRCFCGETEGETVSVGSPLGHDFVDGVCSRCSQKELFTVESVELSIGERIVESYTVEAYSGDFTVQLRINGGEDIGQYAPPTVSWGFKGDAYGSSVSDNGTVTLGEFIGSVTLFVTVESENSVTAELPITVIAGETLEMNSLAVTLNDGYSQNYTEGERFDAESISVWGEHKNGVIRIYGFEVSDKVLTAEDTDVTVTFGELVTELPILVEHDTLLSIEVVTPADRLEYLEGQTFDSSGTVVRAVFGNSSRLVTDFEVDVTTPLALGMESVVINYTFNGVTVSAIQNITVLPKKLESLSVDFSTVRNIYTRGDTFNPKGLTVTAVYEGFDGEVELEYTFVRTVLTPDVTFVEITFTPEDEPVTERIPITVIEPYTEFTHVKVLEPFDVSITWSYTYLTADGERVTDNTAYQPNGLRYDRINGVYEIPLGATVTAYVMDPAVINLALNGMEQTMDYEEKTVSWIMGNADIVVVKSIEMGGAHSVVRFAGGEAEQSFLYEGSWDGRISAEDIARLSIVFADNSEYRHTYLIGGASYSLEELDTAVFGAGETEVTVIKNAIDDDSVEFILHLDGGVNYSVYLSEGAGLDALPVFTLSGYEYDGWALTPDGERLTESQLAGILSESPAVCELYIRRIKETVDYSDIGWAVGSIVAPSQPSYGSSSGSGEGYGSGGGGDNYGASGDDSVNLGNNSGAITSPGYTYEEIDFVGEWKASIYGENETWTVTVFFYSDGTFAYTVKGNGVINTQYTGSYRLDNFVITVISVETEMEIPLVTAEELNMVIKDMSVEINMVVYDGESVILVPCVMKKIDDDIVHIVT